MTSAPLFAGMGGHQIPGPSTTDEWLTPLAILNALGGWQSFDLDPAAPITRPWPMARQHYTVEDSGLTRRWFGRVWLNPPYGRILARWMGRMAEHDCGIALIFARTDTDAFRDHVWERAAALFFLHGRLDFLDVRGKTVPRKGGNGSQNSGAPSVLCAYGQADAGVLAQCGLDGQFVPLRLPRGVVCLALTGRWSDEVLAWARRQRSGPLQLASIYRAFAHHPKSAGNPNYRAKIRQVLQQGPFRRVRRGEWECAAP